MYSDYNVLFPFRTADVFENYAIIKDVDEVLNNIEYTKDELGWHIHEYRYTLTERCYYWLKGMKGERFHAQWCEFVNGYNKWNRSAGFSSSFNGILYQIATEVLYTEDVLGYCGRKEKQEVVGTNIFVPEAFVIEVGDKGMQLFKEEPSDLSKVPPEELFR